MDKIFHHKTESCYLCQNMGHVLIGIFLNVLGAQCSIYVIKYSIFLIFEDLQTTHFLTNLTESFENNAIVSVLKYLSYTGKYLGYW